MDKTETHQNDAPTKIEIVVICNERDRYVPWANVLLLGGASQVDVVCEGEIGYVINGENLNRSGSLITWNDLPTDATAVLVHSGDGGLWKKQIRAPKVFWFDAPGSPAVPDGDIAILVPTAASNFRISEIDAREIIDYSAGKRSELPSCCLRKTASKTQALAAVYLVMRAIQSSQKDESAIRRAWETMDHEWKRRLWTDALDDYEKRGGALKKWSAAGLPDSKSSSLNLPETDMVIKAIDVIKFGLAQDG